ncbi:MAG: hypothetical protein HW380_3171 [Magnetococcales bacterium]|nr:hypothetical protein [Magnetococcales bacterium]
MLLTHGEGAGRRLKSRPGGMFPDATERNWSRPMRRAGGYEPIPWGNPNPSSRKTPFMNRSIPAGAGEPFLKRKVHRSLKVYPRRRGGTSCVSSGKDGGTGQSPQARGNLRPTRREGASFRHGDSHIGWGVPCVGRGIREGRGMLPSYFLDRGTARQGKARDGMGKGGGGFGSPPFFFGGFFPMAGLCI